MTPETHATAKLYAKNNRANFVPPSFCKTATVPKQEVYKSIKTIKARAWAGFMEFLMADFS